MICQRFDSNHSLFFQFLISNTIRFVVSLVKAQKSTLSNGSVLIKLLKRITDDATTDDDFTSINDSIFHLIINSKAAQNLSFGAAGNTTFHQ